MTVDAAGALDIHMKDPGTSGPPYTLRLALPASTGRAGFTIAATLAMPGTFFQLDNSRGKAPALAWNPPELADPARSLSSRERAKQRLRRRAKE